MTVTSNLKSVHLSHGTNYFLFYFILFFEKLSGK